ncbi:hypothetical protein SAMN05660649_00407 [Desulfotomaculum arcticum]|uniref:Uncharacterized protein n=1 Tax=Desulfotruncus arcticus DSM 17038 TaxID=1121424 RepID=A0A1I2N7Q7_9FIRM|nr:hypothetical protein [Desulfotruncus arcticus]SFF99782.1 hypothetical protein SAMN05660649_00407 [Desulfotomaculum arcticum] [Desulfotruncus arcticus DSM 17038]
MSFNKEADYRVNFRENGKILSVEITCCGKHIGEIRFEDGQTKVCPECGVTHSVKIQHNHFHLSRIK